MAAHRRRPGFHGAAAGADPLHADGLGDHGAGAAAQGDAGGRVRQDRRRGRRGAAAEARLHRHGQAPQPGGGGRPPRAGAGRRPRRRPLLRLYHGHGRRHRRAVRRLRRGRARRRPVPPRNPALRRRAGRLIYVRRAADVPGPEMRIKPRRLAHRVTTAHLQAAYFFISEGGLGSEGVYIGRDVFGGTFCYDCFTLYGREITGPNMLVIGQIGYAKSSLVKCLDEDTEIIDPVTGVPRTIAEVFKNEDVTRVLTLDQQRRITAAPIAAKVDVGLDSSCLRVTFASGRSVITTPEHPFLMPDGWRRADQLAVEETAAVPARIPFPEEPARLPDEEVDFLAIMLAEGCYVPGQTGAARFTSADPEIVARMRTSGERLGFGIRNVSRYEWHLTGHARFIEPPDGTCGCGCGRPTPVATRTLNGNVKGQPRRYAEGHSSRRGAAATVLRRHGVPRALSRRKVLPDSIYRLPPDQLARFLGVFWMCDGTVGEIGVSITLASERLVRQLQHLLLRFRIQSGVRFHRSTLNGKAFPSWSLRVYSQCDQRFLDVI